MNERLKITKTTEAKKTTKLKWRTNNRLAVSRRSSRSSLSSLLILAWDHLKITNGEWEMCNRHAPLLVHIQRLSWFLWLFLPVFLFLSRKLNVRPIKMAHWHGLHQACDCMLSAMDDFFTHRFYSAFSSIIYLMCIKPHYNIPVVLLYIHTKTKMNVRSHRLNFVNFLFNKMMPHDY